jgi:hypothetical protein
MKQTAVDWLIGQLYAPCRGIPSHIIEQAEAMEKEQIGRAYQKGLIDGMHGPRKEYYNQPYYTKDYTEEK